MMQLRGLKIGSSGNNNSFRVNHNQIFQQRIPSFNTQVYQPFSTRKQRIEEKLQVLSPTFLEVIDSSEGCEGGNLRVVVTTPLFAGKTQLQRHRKVMELINDEIKTVHSISIVAEKDEKK